MCAERIWTIFFFKLQPSECKQLHCGCKVCDACVCVCALITCCCDWWRVYQKPAFTLKQQLGVPMRGPGSSTHVDRRLGATTAALRGDTFLPAGQRTPQRRAASCPEVSAVTTANEFKGPHTDESEGTRCLGLRSSLCSYWRTMGHLFLTGVVVFTLSLACDWARCVWATYGLQRQRGHDGRVLITLDSLSCRKS